MGLPGYGAVSQPETFCVYNLIASALHYSNGKLTNT